MKKIPVILFLVMMFVGVVGYAGRLHNDYLDHSTAVLQPLSNSILSENPQGVKRTEPMQSLTFAILFGTGLVGMVIIRRK